MAKNVTVQGVSEGRLARGQSLVIQYLATQLCNSGCYLAWREGSIVTSLCYLYGMKDCVKKWNLPFRKHL